ncbi:aromatic hydrocarbon degradation protein [Sphingomonas parva]|uniref:Aromatic hydrocarbon degradation protein n=1 Tax=Sphingomonas parva TaxID=2555898 RepID=A0A4Y8ZS52_9SPHN|nr:outer membrane protein transport protein [Sphingomonas parva]TFI57955.1 aromatic hydrocarbon degradation protein [Sphingomonas parva]
MRNSSRSATRRIQALSLFGTAGACLLTAWQPAEAAGFYLQEQSVRGWGRANSGEVADQGPASLWWNPAATGWAEEGRENLKIDAAFGATAILPNGQVVDQGTLIDRPVVAPAPVGGAAVMHDPIVKGVLPSGSVAVRLADRLSIGLTVASPYSFTTDYDPSGWQRYSAIRTRLFSVDVQPSIAYAATDWLSLGAALNVEYADAWLSNALPNLAPGSPDGRLRLTGDGVDLGWSAGAQLRPAKRVTLGLSYKSAIEHSLKGNVSISGLAGPLAARNFAAETTATFSTPWQLIVGGRAAVTDRVTLNAQMVRFGWSEFDRIDLAAPLSSFIAEGYRNTWSHAFGIDGKVSDALTVRAGIQFDQTPTRDASRDARVPDGNRINYNAGLSYRLGRSAVLDAAIGFTDPEAAPIARDETFYAGTPAQTDVLTAGRTGDAHVVVLSLGGRIGF